MNLRDTIVALATPAGRGGLGVVRLSGADSCAIAAKLLHSPGYTGHALGSAGHEWKPWHAALAELRDEHGEKVDEVVATYARAPRSYTAEDVVEIACHGSPVVLRYCVEAALRAGARMAAPGEFTLRAFLNGRIDLPRAEAVRDLIDATTLYQAKVAAQQVDGSLARTLAPLKEDLLGLISRLEAGIDFAEDATSEIDIPETDDIVPVIERVRAEIVRLAESYSFGRYVHDGFQLAIVGRPNVGKSSLFNALLERDRAIVTEIPGTTRDLVSEQGSIEGIPVRLMDTAGIRSSEDRIEKMGIERSYAAIADADLTILVFDLSSPATDDDLELLRRVSAGGAHLVAANKCDLPVVSEPGCTFHAVSAITRQGIPELRQAIVRSLAPEYGVPPECGMITNARHAGLLFECAAALKTAKQAQLDGVHHEMLLFDLYSSLRPIDAITGATTADDILNNIFNTFCIGK